MIRIVLIDNHRLFRVSLRSLIASFSACQVVLDVASVNELPKNTKAASVDLIIFDPNSAQKKSFERIREIFPSTHVLILTDLLNRSNVKEYMDLGISGFFSKEDGPSELEMSIREISYGLAYKEVKLGSVVREELITDVTNDEKKMVEFSDREMQVLNLVCMERTNAEISIILGLSIRTIESHRRRMIDKTDCRSIIGVILKALEVKSVNLLKSNSRNKAS